MAGKFYEVEKGRTITSTHYGRDFKEGEVIDLSFASDEDCAALLASGAVKETQKRTMTKPTDEQIADAKAAKAEDVKNG